MTQKSPKPPSEPQVSPPESAQAKPKAKQKAKPKPQKKQKPKAAVKPKPKPATPSQKSPAPENHPTPFSVKRLAHRIYKWFLRGLMGCAALLLVTIILFSVVAPPRTITMMTQGRQLGGIEHEWVRLDSVSMVTARSFVAAEDANFCLHWGFDARAIRSAIEGGGARGASSITQQVAKNVFLWQGRSWVRKALETGITPMVELFWTKRRILEVYLNVAELGTGIFGVQAAAKHHFGVSAAELTPVQAARLAAILPAPRDRNPASPSPWLRKRGASVRDGAATIAADGRATCFED
jgi:monofunctional biosynthetic peptidoglycan transglycosylase